MEDIGRRLEAARLAKGLSLQDVEDDTRIRKKYIEALEKGRLTDIPGEVYAKGFLRTYGNYLELNGEALVEEYKRAKAAKEPPEESAGTGRTAAAQMAEREPYGPSVRQPAAGGEKVPRRPASPKPRAADPSIYTARRLLVGLLILLPLAAVAWWGYRALTAAPEPPPPAAKQEGPGSSAPPAVEPKPEPKPEPPKPTVTMAGPTGENLTYTVSTSPVVVEMQFTQGFPWMQATVDGTVQFEGFPKGPVSYSGKRVVIIAGFMDGVSLTINGQPMPHSLTGGRYVLTITGQ
ncbi:MAG: helix-turn-helix domain-containing protein [Bacillota bacterium]